MFQITDESVKSLLDLTKEELIQKILDLECEIESKNKKSPSDESKRKNQVLKLLQEKPMTIFELSEAIGISNKNVSSQIFYLKKDGYNIMTDSNGRKLIKSEFSF